MTWSAAADLDTEGFVRWVDEHCREDVLAIARQWAVFASDCDLYAAWGQVLHKLWDKSVTARSFESETHLRRHCGHMLKTFLRYGWAQDASKYRHRSNGIEYTTRLLSQLDDDTTAEAMFAEVLTEVVSTPAPDWLVEALKGLGEQALDALLLADLAGWSRSEVAQYLGATPEQVKGMLGRARRVIRRALPTDGLSEVAAG